MPRRWLIPALLIMAAALAAACGGDDPEPPAGDDPAPAEQERVADRPPPAGEAPPTTTDTPQEAERPTADVETIDTDTAGVPGPEPGAAGAYTVQAGDTLGDIAARLGTTAAVLADLNNLADPDALAIGQRLVLPGGEAPENKDEADSGDEGDDGTGDDGTTGDGDAGPTPRPAPGTGAGRSPATIPQPGPDVTTDTIPPRPPALDEFAVAALPWLQDRTTPSEIEPLLIDWGMPPVEGDRFFLVDTDADGRFSLIMIYTDPNTDPAHGPRTDANLVVYDPVPGNPARWRLAYDHNLASAQVGQDYAVRTIEDITGDNRRDITYTEVFCDASACTTSLHVLVRDGDGYRDAAGAAIAVPTATAITVGDATADGVPDIVIQGGTSAAAGPPRTFEFVFAAVGDTIQEVRRTGQATSVLVWVLIDGNRAFDRGDFAAALAHYTQAATDAGLDEFIPGARADLVALAQLRSAMTQAQLANPRAALAAAQAAAAGTGLVAELSAAFLGSLAADTGLAVACAAFNAALAPRAAEWDAFWSQFGSGLGEFRAEEICPL